MSKFIVIREIHNHTVTMRRVVDHHYETEKDALDYALEQNNFERRTMSATHSFGRIYYAYKRLDPV